MQTTNVNLKDYISDYAFVTSATGSAPSSDVSIGGLIELIDTEL